MLCNLACPAPILEQFHVCSVFLVHAFLSYLTSFPLNPAFPVFALVLFCTVLYLAGVTGYHPVQPLECGDHPTLGGQLEMGNIRETSRAALVQGSHLGLAGLRPFESPKLWLLSGDLSPSRLLRWHYLALVCFVFRVHCSQYCARVSRVLAVLVRVSKLLGLKK